MKSGSLISGLSFARKVAFRYLWTKRSEAFISIITVASILGVALSVIVLNVVMSVMSGFENELRTKISSTDSHIVLGSYSGGLTEWRGLASELLAKPGIVSVSPFTQTQVLIREGNRSGGLLIRGIEAESEGAKQLERYLIDKDVLSQLFPQSGKTRELTEGDYSLPGLVVGKQLARSMGLGIGSGVTLLSPQFSSSPFGLVPRFKNFKVIGFYSSGLVEYESGVAYAALPDTQKYFGWKDGIGGLEIRVKDLEESTQIAASILNSLGGVTSGYYVRDWKESNKPLWEAIKMEKNVYFIVLLLLIVLASFSIITTLVMLVLEKRKDIAIMKTIGASSRQVGLIFLIQGSVIGLFGTLLGIIGSLIGCYGLKEYGFPIDERIFQMSTVPVLIDFSNFTMVALASFFICSLATIYPAFRASRLEPCEILRHE